METVNKNGCERQSAANAMRRCAKEPKRKDTYGRNRRKKEDKKSRVDIHLNARSENKNKNPWYVTIRREAPTVDCR